MNDVIAWRIMCRHLILGLVFVPAFALLLHEKRQPAGPEVDRGPASITHDVGSKGLQAR
jgi:hypothetical protein